MGEEANVQGGKSPRGGFQGKLSRGKCPEDNVQQNVLGEIA